MKKPVILILEDGEIELHALTRALLTLDVEVVICTTPEDGLRTLDEVRLIDFVISDGRGWRDCYLTAIKLFGSERVVIYSGYREAWKDAAIHNVVAIDKGISVRESAEYLREVLVGRLSKKP